MAWLISEQSDQFRTVNITTICVQPWSVNVLSYMLTFQTRQFPWQLWRLDQLTNVHSFVLQTKHFHWSNRHSCLANCFVWKINMHEKTFTLHGWTQMVVFFTPNFTAWVFTLHFTPWNEGRVKTLIIQACLVSRHEWKFSVVEWSRRFTPWELKFTHRDREKNSRFSVKSISPLFVWRVTYIQVLRIWSPLIIARNSSRARQPLSRVNLTGFTTLTSLK